MQRRVLQKERQAEARRGGMSGAEADAGADADAAAACGEFVEGWLVAQVLGEGAYGE